MDDARAAERSPLSSSMTESHHITCREVVELAPTTSSTFRDWTRA